MHSPQEPVAHRRGTTAPHAPCRRAGQPHRSVRVLAPRHVPMDEQQRQDAADALLALCLWALRERPTRTERTD